jgi:hypothetical protein
MSHPNAYRVRQVLWLFASLLATVSALFAVWGLAP